MSLPKLTIHTNIWLETDDGDVALSRWRLELLEAIDRTGSISAAAHDMGIQYRLAWNRIHEMEERLGLPLVRTTVGGRGGGGAHLTPDARIIVQHLQVMFAAIDAEVQKQGVVHLQRLEKALRE
jgi:molybdate transport system regulatory protein